MRFCVKRECFLVTLDPREFVLANIRRFFRTGYRGKQIKDKKDVGFPFFPFRSSRKRADLFKGIRNWDLCVWKINNIYFLFYFPGFDSTSCSAPEVENGSVSRSSPPESTSNILQIRTLINSSHQKKTILSIFSCRHFRGHRILPRGIPARRRGKVKRIFINYI